LATALYLHEHAAKQVSYTLIESSARWGGKMLTTRQDGFIAEGGPDSFIAQKQEMLELCRSLGLEDELIGSNTPKGASTFVLSKGKLHPMPEGMMLMAPTMVIPFLRSRLISWWGKLRMGLEVFVPKTRGDADESLGSFVRRRLGKEALDMIAAPLMAGIHSADPERMSLRSTFPMFIDMEKTYGSLLRGVASRKKTQTARTAPMFLSFKDGIETLSRAMVKRLNPDWLRLNCGVKSVTGGCVQYCVELHDGTKIYADDVVFATPAYVTADLVRGLDPSLAAGLDAIPYVSTAAISLGYKRSDVGPQLDGYGFVIPSQEGRKINACSWSSQKFSYRAPEDCILLRAFVGGACSPDSAEQDEQTLITLAMRELKDIMEITATPILTQVSRWIRANPQYEVGHDQRVKEIERGLASYPGLHLAGSAYFGSGIPDCIKSGVRAASTVLKRLRLDGIDGSDRSEAVALPS
jgi:oxygen-dependent protoporphyrinogen oxidase